jgi:hypothetical protein
MKLNKRKKSMTNHEWVGRFVKIWIGMFAFMFFLFYIAFKVPYSPRFNYIDDSTLRKILSELINIYFPYIGVSVAGFLSVRKKAVKIDPNVQGFAKSIWYLIILFNGIMLICSISFITDSLSSADLTLYIFSTYASKFSLLIAGLSVYLYDKL